VNDATNPPPAVPPGKPAIKMLMMPRDTNVHGTIFGGAILSHIDQAGAVHARTLGCDRVVTVAVDRVEFTLPVYVGDVLCLHCRTLRVGRTSLTVSVDVWADRFAKPHETIQVTEAQVTYVHVDDEGQPRPVPRPDA